MRPALTIGVDLANPVDGAALARLEDRLDLLLRTLKYGGAELDADSAEPLGDRLGRRVRTLEEHDADELRALPGLARTPLILVPSDGPEARRVCERLVHRLEEEFRRRAAADRATQTLSARRYDEAPGFLLRLRAEGGASSGSGPCDLRVRFADEPTAPRWNGRDGALVLLDPQAGTDAIVAADRDLRVIFTSDEIERREPSIAASSRQARREAWSALRERLRRLEDSNRSLTFDGYRPFERTEAWDPRTGHREVRFAEPTPLADQLSADVVPHSQAHAEDFLEQVSRAGHRSFLVAPRELARHRHQLRGILATSERGLPRALADCAWIAAALALLFAALPPWHAQSFLGQSASVWLGVEAAALVWTGFWVERLARRGPNALRRAEHGALDEGSRVQLHWMLAGIERSAADELETGSPCGWIAPALRSFVIDPAHQARLFREMPRALRAFALRRVAIGWLAERADSLARAAGAAKECRDRLGAWSRLAWLAGGLLLLATLLGPLGLPHPQAPLALLTIALFVWILPLLGGIGADRSDRGSGTGIAAGSPPAALLLADLRCAWSLLGPAAAVAAIGLWAAARWVPHLSAAPLWNLRFFLVGLALVAWGLGAALWRRANDARRLADAEDAAHLSRRFAELRDRIVPVVDRLDVLADEPGPTAATEFDREVGALQSELEGIGLQALARCARAATVA